MREEVIQIEDTSSAEEKSREERKANGRLIAVIVALLLIFIAIYHAWIRKTAVLAGVLVPALIMILYGGWVVFLAKRDKRRRLLLARQMGENARREILAKQFNLKSSCKDNKEIQIVAKTSESEKKTSRKSKKSDLSRVLPTSSIRRKWRDKPSFRHRIFRPNVQTEALIKSRQEYTPLCRTFSAPP